MANRRIRQLAKNFQVKLWRIADALGITDSTLSRKLRHELSEEETARIIAIINELTKEA